MRTLNQRVAIYVGQRYLAFTAPRYVQLMARHFDDLVRAAVVHGHEAATWIAGLAKKVTGTLGPQIALQLGHISRNDMLSSYPAGFEEKGFTMAHALLLADYLEETVPPGGTALTWGRPMVMPYLARRPLPVRFASFALADLARPPFERSQEWTEEVERAFRRKPPRVVVLYRDPAGGYLYLGGSRGASALSRVVARELEASYRRDASFGPAECFVRRDDS